jgi:hypothetical protein
MPGHEWLGADAVSAWVKVDASDARLELARLAAASWCESQRPDLLTVGGLGVEPLGAGQAPADAVVAGCIAVDRLLKTGRASYSDFGAADVLPAVVELYRLLGVGTHARPALG